MVVQRKPCLALVASRDNNFGDAVEHALDAFCSDMLRSAHVPPHDRFFLCIRELSITSA
ncbi:hypothetical protein [Mesorhizobium sp. dw_380]|uniref:hypothetical protein n=1 Tax=Mesorhizobium sp. dw_380 TaxID=2812001 RepID=UPI001BDEB1E7|nr:hypothetical protein [Mesorhizobium sp. dw_380]